MIINKQRIKSRSTWSWLGPLVLFFSTPPLTVPMKLCSFCNYGLELMTQVLRGTNYRQCQRSEAEVWAYPTIYSSLGCCEFFLAKMAFGEIPFHLVYRPSQVFMVLSQHDDPVGPGLWSPTPRLPNLFSLFTTQPTSVFLGIRPTTCQIPRCSCSGSLWSETGFY